MALANDGVGFPMAWFSIGLDHWGTQVNTDPIRNKLPLEGLAPLLVPLTVTNTKILDERLMVNGLPVS